MIRLSAGIEATEDLVEDFAQALETLNSRGIEAKHVTEIGLAEASDRQIGDYVTQADCVLISKDQDFLNFAPQSKTGSFIWVRRGNCLTAALLLIFENLWVNIEECFARGDRVIEIR